MQYRKFGKLDWEVSAASLGILRLETVVAEEDGIDWETRKEAAGRALDLGVNLVNLGYPMYFKDSDAAYKFGSEVVKMADGRAKIALNVLSRHIESRDDLDRCFNEQLERFGIEKVDFCLLDWVYRKTWEKLKEVDVAAWARDIIASGKAEHMGIIFHDDAYYLDDINKTYPGWDMMQFEYSFMDHKHHPGAGGKKFIAQYEQGLVATDCTKGGRLLKNIPENVQKVWDESKGDFTVAERCIRWALTQDAVSTVMFDFESVQQVEEYVAAAEACTPGSADMFETLRADFAKDAYFKNRQVQCSACRCCMPCEFDVDAPRVMEHYNDYIMYSDVRIPRFLYNLERHPEIECVKCGRCERICPREFDISGLQDMARETFKI